MNRNQHQQNAIATWLGSYVVPHEASLRAWLRRTGVADGEIDDIVHNAYVRLAELDSVAHIRDSRAYFFKAARSLMLQQVRRRKIVRIEALNEIDVAALEDDVPLPDRYAAARQELAHVRTLIAALPDRCREIFELRRIQGVSQREIAARLGVAEHIVEAQASRGLKLILRAIAAEDASVAETSRNCDDPDYTRHRRR